MVEQCVIGFGSGGQLVLVPERANVYIDRFTLPGETAALVAAQICRVVETTGILGEYTDLG